MNTVAEAPTAAPFLPGHPPPKGSGPCTPFAEIALVLVKLISLDPYRIKVTVVLNSVNASVKHSFICPVERHFVGGLTLMMSNQTFIVAYGDQ